jgi:hypothetical protein
MAKKKAVDEAEIVVTTEENTEQTAQEQPKEVVEAPKERPQGLINLKHRRKKVAQKMLYLNISVPYTSVPSINSPATGILDRGQTFYVMEEVDTKEEGSFYKVGPNMYINKDWNIKVYE